MNEGKCDGFFIQKKASGFIAVKVYFEKKLLYIVLADGREIRVPLELYPRLRNANSPQRKNYQSIGHGTGTHWPDVDEDLSVEGIVLGISSSY